MVNPKKNYNFAKKRDHRQSFGCIRRGKNEKSGVNVYPQESMVN